MRARTAFACMLLVLLDSLVGGTLASDAYAASLFPVDLPSREWRQFEAVGYSAPVCGVVYRTDAPPTNGMPVGGIDTGCLDLEADGLLGYCTLFNSHVPRRGPIGLPYLGVVTGGQTWVLCTPRAKAGMGLVSLNPWQLDTILGPHQRLWAPGPASLPAWFKSVGELPYDVPTGRVACHSPAVLRWTSPGDGELRIEGGLWLARNLDRPQRWELRKSGELLASGRLEWGPTSQTPLSLVTADRGGAALMTQVTEGDSLELIVTNAATFGDYIGIDLKLTLGGRTWDVAADWSDECNPNGCWTYDSVSREASASGLFGADSPLLPAEDIVYWGHYPVADMEFQTSAPIEIGLRTWSPFIPGDVKTSMLPGAVFEVRLHNPDNQSHSGTVVMSFPGPTLAEAGDRTITRKPLGGGIQGVEVQGKLASWALAVAQEGDVRVGGGLQGSRRAWATIGERLPEPAQGDTSAAVAVDFELAPGASRVVPFLLTWLAPTWKGGGTNASAVGNTFTHMYARSYPDVGVTAQLLASQRQHLFQRVAAWQQVVYSEEKLPIWLRDSLINVLYMMTEDSYWAQKAAPLPEWVKEEDGLFGLNECPRGCPQIECIPCSFYGSLPLTYFFPELQLSTIRGYQGYQGSQGAPPWIFGSGTEFAGPVSGHNYQASTNGISLAGIVDRFLMCRDTPDKKLTKELYPMMKKCLEWQVTIGVDGNPSFKLGQQLLAMPNFEGNKEWFEADQPGWFGMVAHVGILHIAFLRIMERMANDVGDAAFAKQCADWTKAAQDEMEKSLWDERGFYLNCYDPVTGQKNEMVFGYQLDGEWVTHHHGLPFTVPAARVKTVLATLKKFNVAVTQYGAVNYTNPDGSPIRQAQAGTWDYGVYSYFPPELLMLAMTYMYAGEVDFGLELARKSWHNLICLQGYTWDMPNIMRGDVDTGERVFGSDYYQDMMLWSLPAAIAGQPADSPCQPGGLVDRMLQAGKKGD